MTNETWNAEAARFLALRGEERWKWMADLLFALTVFARDRYTVGGVGLDDPERMRRFNELAHRTADQLRHQIGGTPCLPDDIFAKMVGEEAEALGFGVKDLEEVLS